MNKSEQVSRELQRRRLRGGRLLSRGVAQAEVARRVGVTRSTVSDWNELLHTGGLDALKRRPRGRPAGLDTAQRRELMRALTSGALAEGFATDLWTLPRVTRLIERRFARAYSESHVWRVLVSLDFSCRRPAGRALERDEAAIQHWKRKRWPVLKKRRETRPNRRLHRRVGTERAAHPGTDLGAAWRDAGPAVPLQLASALGHCRDHLPALPLPAVSRCDQRSADHRVSPRPGASDPQAPAGDLGRSARASLGPGARLPRSAERRHSVRAAAGLRTRTQPH